MVYLVTLVMTRVTDQPASVVGHSVHAVAVLAPIADAVVDVLAAGRTLRKILKYPVSSLQKGIQFTTCFKPQGGFYLKYLKNLKEVTSKPVSAAGNLF